MQEYLSNLGTGDWVLDLGCRRGSFDPALVAAKVVLLDLSYADKPGDRFVQADAAAFHFLRLHSNS
jgi:hypothetical protein